MLSLKLGRGNIHRDVRIYLRDCSDTVKIPFTFTLQRSSGASHQEFSPHTFVHTCSQFLQVLLQSKMLVSFLLFRCLYLVVRSLNLSMKKRFLSKFPIFFFFLSLWYSYCCPVVPMLNLLSLPNTPTQMLPSSWRTNWS